MYILTKKMFLSHSRTALSEKKPTVKPKSPEKGKPDEKDPEKSPTKKQEGRGCLEILLITFYLKTCYLSKGKDFKHVNWLGISRLKMKDHLLFF